MQQRLRRVWRFEHCEGCDDAPHGPFQFGCRSSLPLTFGQIGVGPKRINYDERCGVLKQQLPYWWSYHQIMDYDDIIRPSRWLDVRKMIAQKGWYFNLYVVPIEFARIDNKQVVFVPEAALSVTRMAWDKVPGPIVFDRASYHGW